MQDSAHWEEIKRIFQHALDLPAEQRTQYLDKSCKDSPEIRQEVESLLAAYEETPDILEEPALTPQKQMVESQTDQFIGQQIGPYKIKKEIGRGGMGIIYLAKRVDGQFEKQVAIKVARFSLTQADSFQRFSNERQILASLEHSYIARLYDSGATADGFPYFIMEFIDGMPIDAFCDKHQMTIRERLNLFREVCAAVHFAHQHLIVHRDLKPSNILVTRDGTPKLLDFGIAKLLQPNKHVGANELTMTGVRVFTPEYASPEQIRGERITTASDIYSLGVILYRLLTGHRLYRTDNLQPYEIARAVLEDEPAKPSLIIRKKATKETEGEKPQPGPEKISRLRRESLARISRQLKGDLDNIVLKALKKEPGERYHSVEQLSADIHQYQVGLPTIARGDSPGYRTIKFVQRHKMGVLSGVLLLLVLIGGILSTTWQARLAKSQRDIALKAANSMIYELAQEMSQSMGPTENRIELLNQAVKIFDQVTQLGYKNTAIKFQTADAHRILANTYRSLGEIERANHYIQQAKLTIDQLVQQNPDDRKYSILQTRIWLEYGEILNAQRKYGRAKAVYDSALSIGRQNLTKWGTDPAIIEDVSMLLVRLGDRQYYENQLAASEASYQEGFVFMQRELEKNPQDADYLSKYAITIERLGDVFYARGRIDQCCEKYQQALEIRQQANRIEPNNVNIQRMLANSLGYVGWCAEQQQDWSAAISLYDEAINIQQNLHRVDPGNIVYISNLIGLLGTRGEILFKQNQVDSAIHYYKSALDLWSAAHEKDISTPHLDFKSVQISELLGDALRNRQQLQSAMQTIKQAIATLDSLLKKDQMNHDYLDLKAQLLISRGDLFASMAYPLKSLVSYQSATVVYDSLTSRSNFSIDFQRQAHAYYKYATGLLKNQKTSEAKTFLRKAQNILLKLRKAGKLADNSEGYRIYLPQINQTLETIP